jgi:hypothetical protein
MAEPHEEGGADILTGILFGNVNEDGVAELDYLDEVCLHVLNRVCHVSVSSRSDPRWQPALAPTQAERQHLSRIGSVLRDEDRRDLVQVGRPWPTRPPLLGLLAVLAVPSSKVSKYPHETLPSP